MTQALPTIEPDEAVVPARSRRRPGVVAGAVAAVLVTGVVVAVAEVRGGHGGELRSASSAAPAAAPPAAPVDPATLVVRDGDRIEGDGRVVAVEGEPVVFCGPQDSDLVVHPDPDPYLSCDLRLEVTGVDVGSLENPSFVPATVDHAAYGTAMVHLTGVLDGDRLTDVVPTPYVPGVDPLAPPPCDAPPGGWPQNGGDTDPTALDTYRDSHPGAILVNSRFQASPTQAVAYALTSGDPAPVRTALAATYGSALCVVRSDFTAAQLGSAVTTFGLDTPLSRAARVSGIGPHTLQPDGQLAVDLGLPFVTPAIAAAADTYPAGLVHVDPWLTPMS